MQKLLDAELENHLEYSKYEHTKNKKQIQEKDQITILISAVNEETEKWRKRKLKSMYVFTYADCLYVPIKNDITSEKWKKPIQNWKTIQAQLLEIFGERYTKHLEF